MRSVATRLLFAAALLLLLPPSSCSMAATSCCRAAMGPSRAARRSRGHIPLAAKCRSIAATDSAAASEAERIVGGGTWRPLPEVIPPPPPPRVTAPLSEGRAAIEKADGAGAKAALPSAGADVRLGAAAADADAAGFGNGGGGGGGKKAWASTALLASAVPGSSRAPVGEVPETPAKAPVGAGRRCDAWEES